MGIDFHAFQFIRYVLRNRAAPVRALTLGRQSLHIPEWRLRKLITLGDGYKQAKYCEELLSDYFGIQEIHSTDNSAYEQATHILDLNQPITAKLDPYDLILDCGTLEHVFNVPQALSSVSAICAKGGQIVHVLPANNLCGHGFWQFSPELFFSLYSRANGYEETVVFMADISQETEWFRVIAPTGGSRIKIQSSNPLYVMCCTTRIAEHFSHSGIQQSDYVHLWSAPRAEKSKRNSAAVELLKKSPFANVLRQLRDTASKFSARDEDLLRSRSGQLERVSINALFIGNGDRR
jgi:hypothetical protein